jgi:acyl carrier protein
MERARIRAEVIELISHKLYSLPPIAANGDEGGHDYDGTRIRTVKGDDGQVETQGLTDNPLDLHEVGMDLEDAFGVSFDDKLPGDEGLETIGDVVAHIHARVNRAR